MRDEPTDWKCCPTSCIANKRLPIPEADCCAFMAMLPNLVSPIDHLPRSNRRQQATLSTMDGLSVAASVVGVVSLGIGVAQSLIDFYMTHKAREPSIAHTTKKLERLLGIFETLQQQLAKRKFQPDEQQLLQDIENSISDCEEFICELQAETDKFKNQPTDGVRAAARTAARRVEYPFRKSTLLQLDENIEEVVSHLSLALQVLQQSDIGAVQDDIEDVKGLLKLVRAAQVSSMIRDWLKAPDASVNYHDACNKRHPRTGLWFVQGAAFASWLTTPSSFLWLKGFAGCGKSVLCSTAIQYTFRHRRSSPRIGLAFFFFTFNEETKQDASAMLCALVLQLSSQLDDSQGPLLQLHASHPNTAPTVQALVGCLHQLVCAFDHVYITLDALDESPRGKRRREMLQVLTDIRGWSEPQLHIMVTSRDEVDIRDVLCREPHTSPVEVIPMSNDFIDTDIATYVSGHLKVNSELRRWRKYHDQIEKQLIKRADGV